ncbi:alpha-sarcoglycan-like [Asterias amurensis]|uniref:alpha-sarcoglycan-like n=1 Tax=Asterias amurensis TaxID=7602 RepID=UPI003AB28E86
MSSSSLLCAVVSAVLVSVLSLATGEDAEVGVNFQYVFEKEDFFGSYSLGPDQPGPVIYKPSLVDKPGLPRWLQYVQTDPARQGYVYGTPDDASIGDIILEIIALNTNTYQSARVEVQISITEQPESPSYLATFFLSNQNLEDMLPATKQQEFLRRVSLAWSSPTQLVIHRLSPGPTDTTEEGIPLLPGTSKKLGVYVIVGSTTPFSGKLLSVRTEVMTECMNGSYKPFKLHQAFDPEFVVQWCQLVLTQPNQLSLMDPSPSSPGPIHLGDEYMPPALTTTPPDHLIEFLFIVVPPLIVALVFIIVLGLFMCTCREGKKRATRTPEIQLTHHQGIRQASSQLRALSNRRDGASSSSSPSTPIIPHGANPAISSVHSSPRHHIRDPDSLPMTSTPLFSRTSPPPYRVPSQNQQPVTPTTPRGCRETTFSDPFDSRRLSEPEHPRGRPMPSPIRSPPPFMSGSAARGNPYVGSAC